MRKLLFTGLIALFFGFVSNAQIKKVETSKKVEIGKITPGGVKTIYCEKINDEFYTFHYKDAKFTKIEEWKSFKINSEQDFNDLYDVIIQGFKDMPEEDIMLETPTGFIWLNYKKFLGKPIIRFGFTTSKSEYANIGFSNEYTEKQIDKLFGKK